MPKIVLQKIAEEIWELLELAVRERSSSWRIMSLATVDAEGRPSVRQVVLRVVKQREREFLFFTDPRTPKWRELRGNGEAEVLFWDAEGKVQLRCRGVAELHEGDELAADYRKQVPAHLAGDYTAQRVPGEAIAEPEMGAECGESWNFGVVILKVEKMDWLRLSSEGHKRAELGWEGEQWQAAWVQP